MSNTYPQIVERLRSWPINKVPEEYLGYFYIGFHFLFERNEEDESLEWVKHHFKKHQPFMDWYVNWTYPTFEWNNYRKFRGDNDPCKEKAEILGR